MQTSATRGMRRWRSGDPRHACSLWRAAYPLTVVRGARSMNAAPCGHTRLADRHGIACSSRTSFGYRLAQMASIDGINKLPLWESAHVEGALWAAGIPYVFALRPSRGSWTPEEEAHPPREATEALSWNGPDEPGDRTRVVRRFRDGHTQV